MTVAKIIREIRALPKNEKLELFSYLENLKTSELSDANDLRTFICLDGTFDKWFHFVDKILIPSLPNAFSKYADLLPSTNHHVFLQKVYLNLTVGRKNIDLIWLYGNPIATVLVFDVACNLNIEDIKEHLKTLTHFKEFFPEYKDKPILGAVAGIKVTENADEFAHKRGLFVLGQSDDTVAITNDNDFTPKVW